MKFVNHYNLEGRHAILSPSKWRWLNYDNKDDYIRSLVSSKLPDVGTALHLVAQKRIKHGIGLTKFNKNDVLLYLLEFGIPSVVINNIDFDFIYENLKTYVNDAIGYMMQPEVELYYSEQCFGTADALAFTEHDSFLRIHDLKTGVIPAHIEQLLIYAGLFFLQYKHIKLADSKIELRIYQNNDILIHNPEVDEILPVMEKIKMASEYLEGVLK